MTTGNEAGRAAPEIAGMDSGALAAHWRLLREHHTRAFVVVRDDRVAFEEYGDDWDAGKLHYTASAAKAVVGGLSLMLAVDDGLIGIDDPACKYIGQWQDDPVKSRITIRQLAAHASGLDDAHEDGVAHRDQSGWKGAFWRQEPDPFRLSRDETPVMFSPGTGYLYSNPGIAMLTYAVTASLKGSPYSDIRTLLWERIAKPIGIREEEWQIGYGKTFEQDGLQLVPSWGGGSLTANALARIGRLLAHYGSWEGEPLIRESVVREALAHSGLPSFHSFGFWVNADLAGRKRWPSLPWDTVMALGAENQILLVSPSRRLVVVRNGGDLDPAMERARQDEKLERYIGEPLAAALGDPAPYPASDKIVRLEWAPTSTIVRLATGEKTRDGSDNWPVTWADDGNLYTAYGDGYGFEPSLPHKLGMGFARIRGDSVGFSCENIRSDGENTGYGGEGEKASGLLMVDGVLYLWVRNANRKGEQSRLARSTDYARTWQWCDWRFESFGHIAFVNYGRNYEGARDGFVYMVSHDHPSPYAFADRFILMRAPAGRLTDRDAYEFYRGTDSGGEPLWSGDANEREAVFVHPRRCCRSSISYNASIGRYLWWHQMPLVESKGRVDTRFAGGVGIYEAPEPWGPWRTVYFAEKWDTGPGDLGCFPTKWMSPDGRSVCLVFAGNDNFSLRRATLTVRD